MTIVTTDVPVTPLRQLMQHDMLMRGLCIPSRIISATSGALPPSSDALPIRQRRRISDVS